MVDVPNSVVITRIDGTNHCQMLPPTRAAHRARPAAGRTGRGTPAAGSSRTPARTGRAAPACSSRAITIRMSRSRLGRAGSRSRCEVADSSTVVIRLPFRSVFAQAAAGEVEEHVVEGRAVHLRRRDRYAAALRRPRPVRAAPPGRPRPGRSRSSPSATTSRARATSRPARQRAMLLGATVTASPVAGQRGLQRRRRCRRRSPRRGRRRPPARPSSRPRRGSAW